MARFVGKIQFYLQNGVRMVWVVDPAARSIAVLVRNAEEILLAAGDTLEGGDVLPGFSIMVDEIFAQLPSGQLREPEHD